MGPHHAEPSSFSYVQQKVLISLPLMHLTVTSKTFFKETVLHQNRKKRRKPSINYRIRMGSDCVVFP